MVRLVVGIDFFYIWVLYFFGSSFSCGVVGIFVVSFVVRMLFIGGLGLGLGL